MVSFARQSSQGFQAVDSHAVLKHILDSFLPIWWYQGFKLKINLRAIKIHLLEHIDQSLSYIEEEFGPDESENEDPKIKETKSYNIMDKFGADGRPLCDSDSDSDTDSS